MVSNNGEKVNPNLSQKTQIFYEANSLWDEGYSLIPLRGKKPVIKWKSLQTKRLDWKEFVEIFNFRRASGYAIITGPPSVLDLDAKEGCDIWQSEHTLLDKLLPKVSSSLNRMHIWFDGPYGHTLHKHGEYKSDNKHYVVGPGSLHPRTGQVYKWITPRKLPLMRIPLEEMLGSLVLTREDRARREEARDSEGRSTPSQTAPIFERVEKYKSPPSLDDLSNLALENAPLREGVRNFSILSYIRSLKRLKARWNLYYFNLAFEEWLSISVRDIGTKEKDISKSDFISAWNSYERKELIIIRGTNTLETLLLTMRGMANFKNEFYICQESIGERLGIHQSTISKHIKTLKNRGDIELVREGNSSSGKANVYRIIKS